MAEKKIKVTAVTNAGELRDFANATREANQALSALQATGARSPGVGAQGGAALPSWMSMPGMAPSGRPTPGNVSAATLAALAQAERAPVGATPSRPPAPPPPITMPAPTLAYPAVAAPPPPLTAHAPPPAAVPPPIPPPIPFGAYNPSGTPGAGAYGGINPSANAPAPGSPDDPRSPPSDALGRAQSGARSVLNVAGAGIGIALGTSLTGFGIQSAQHYLETSKVIAQLGREFRETGTSADFFAGRLGHTIAVSAQAARAYGEQTGGFDRGGFRESLGFARTFGLDPTRTAGTIGRLSRLGLPTDTGALSAIAGRAEWERQGQGRFGEYLNTLTSLAERQLSATGGTSLAPLLGANALPSMVFGLGSPLASGDRALDFTDRLQSDFTRQGSPLATFLARVSGYGRDPSVSYEDMRLREEAGIYDPRNIRDLMGFVNQMPKGQQFSTLEGILPSLGAREIRSLRDAFPNQDALDALMQTYEKSPEMAQRHIERVLAGEGTNVTGGYERAGAGFVSRGEAAAVDLESAMMTIGEPTSRAILDMRDILGNIAGGLSNLAGGDLGSLLTDLTGTLKGLSENIKALTGSGALAGATGRGAGMLLNPDAYQSSNPGVEFMRQQYASGSMFANPGALIMPGYGLYRGAMNARDYISDPGTEMGSGP